MNIRIEEKLILEALFKNEDPLSTTQLKASTGIDTDGLGYSVRSKLEPEGLVDYWYEDRNGTETRVHQLTEKGESEIQQGLIGDIFSEGPTEEELERVALESRVDELEERVESVENKTQANKELIDEINSRLDQAAEYIREFDIRLNGLRWAFAESPLELDIDQYVQKVRENSE